MDVAALLERLGLSEYGPALVTQLGLKTAERARRLTADHLRTVGMLPLEIEELLDAAKAMGSSDEGVLVRERALLRETNSASEAPFSGSQALSASSGSLGQPAVPVRVRALIVGCENYTGLKPLDNPISDAAALAHVLEGAGAEVRPVRRATVLLRASDELSSRSGRCCCFSTPPGPNWTRASVLSAKWGCLRSQRCSIRAPGHCGRLRSFHRVRASNRSCSRRRRRPEARRSCGSPSPQPLQARCRRLRRRTGWLGCSSSRATGWRSAERTSWCATATEDAHTHMWRICELRGPLPQVPADFAVDTDLAKGLTESQKETMVRPWLTATAAKVATRPGSSRYEPPALPCVRR